MTIITTSSFSLSKLWALSASKRTSRSSNLSLFSFLTQRSVDQKLLRGRAGLVIKSGTAQILRVISLKRCIEHLKSKLGVPQGVHERFEALSRCEGQRLCQQNHENYLGVGFHASSGKHWSATGLGTMKSFMKVTIVSHMPSCLAYIIACAPEKAHQRLP